MTTKRTRSAIASLPGRPSYASESTRGPCWAVWGAPSLTRSVTGRTPRRRVGGFASSSQQYTPLSAAGLFDEALEVQTTISQLYTDSPGDVEATFRVYYSPPEVGVNDGATVFVCVHGAGYSGLSFARFARSLVDSNRGPQDGDGGENIGKVGVLAYDARGHGELAFPLVRKSLPHAPIAD